MNAVAKHPIRDTFPIIPQPNHNLLQEIEEIPAIKHDMAMIKVLDFFHDHPDHTFFPVLDENDYPIGVVREKHLKDFAYAQYGWALLANRPLNIELQSFVSDCPVADIGANAAFLLKQFSKEETLEGFLIIENKKYRGFLSAKSLIKMAHRRELDLVKRHNEELAAINEQMQRELQLAAKVQQAIMTWHHAPKFLQSEVLYQPCGKVSGDIYEGWLDSNGNLNVFLGDATGHGVSASLITMVVKTGLKALPGDLPPCQVMSQLDQLLGQCTPTSMFVSGICLQISPDGVLRSSNAGHPPMLVIPASGDEAIRIRNKGMLLGVGLSKQAQYQDAEYRLNPGDKIYMFTDGIIESLNQQERFGINRLIAFLENYRTFTINQTLAKFMEHITQFTGHLGFQDDVTMLGFEFQ